ncbi:ester cyclase [Bacillus pseudomycoides]|uniref:ester cyclase n=1 Tax=Bacillus pseudomycoides TaxID=64104 RepID=UPI0023DACB36|nr:ester cyclase [Bacillus pseudomycoides]MDF2085729.1 ester cyclase [Bacillus pseudomycoides]
MMKIKNQTKKLWWSFSFLVICIVIIGTILTTCSNTKTSASKSEIQLLKGSPEPKTMTIDPSLSQKDATAMIHTAQRFYAFWDTGNEELIPQTVTEKFFDNTLPKGRPQGPEGLAFAAKNFRKVVPDIHCKIEDLLVVGDKVTARLSFTGTHNGKPISFFAIDILRIKDGKITEDWHLEDNLTLMQQLGVVAEN